jgi:DNA-binding response OmpR family regulator
MGEGSGSKKQLGKIMLQQKLVTANELEDMLDEQGKRGGRLASTAARDGKVSVTEVLRVLSEQHGVPAIDLSRQVVPLSNLLLVPVEMAREHVVLPVRVHGEQLVLAMASPQNETSVEELKFVTAMSVFPHVALDQALRLAIEEAYALHEAGHAHWVGERVTDEELAELSVARPPHVDVQVPEALPAEGASPAAAGPSAVEAPAAHESPESLTEDERVGVVHGRPTRNTGPELDQAFSERPKASPSQQPQASYHDKKVLVVDDDDDVRRLIKLTLEHAAIPVLEADSGMRALEMIRDESPDVILLDAVLPGLHGFDICRRLRGSQRYGGIPIVIVSAIHRGWRVAEDLRETYGVEHLFDKPIDLQKLTRTVRLLLEGKVVTHDDAELSSAAHAELENGMQAFERGSLDDAIAHLQAGVHIDPLAFELQYHLGLLYGRREDLFSAIEALETAIGLAPRHFSALKNLAVVYQRAGFRHKSLEVWQRATANAPDDETRAHIKEHMVTLL